MTVFSGSNLNLKSPPRPSTPTGFASQKDFDGLKNTLGSLAGKIPSVETMLKNDRNAYLARFGSIDKAVGGLSKNISAINNTIDGIKSNYTSQVSSLSKQLTSMLNGVTNNVKGMQAGVSNAATKAAGNSAAIAKLSQQFASLNGGVISLNGQFAKTGASIGSNKIEIGKNADAISVLTGDLTDHETLILANSKAIKDNESFMRSVGVKFGNDLNEAQLALNTELEKQNSKIQMLTSALGFVALTSLLRR